MVDERPIFLVGFMGCGKTTIGRQLAAALNWDFIDLDDEIVAQAGCSIAEIFAAQGEACFRQLETAALRAVANRSRVVVALGGGAFITPANRDLIAQYGRSIYLDCPFETILARVSNDPTRPLSRPPAQLRELWETRRPIYRTAGQELSVADLSPAEAVARLLTQL